MWALNRFTPYFFIRVRSISLTNLRYHLLYYTHSICNYPAILLAFLSILYSNFIVIFIFENVIHIYKEI